MGIKRIVDTSFWTDGKIDEFTPEDKYFMLYLLTNPFTTQLGIYEISIKQVAFQLGYSVDCVTALLDRFDNKYGVIIFSKETNEVAIKNFLRHSIVKGGKPVEDCLRKELKKVKNKGLICKVFQHISDYDTLNDTVKKIINEYEIDNDNDNDNDVSYHDSYHDSSANRQTQEKINIKDEFETLWKLYPNKKGKDKALGYYQKARKSGTTFEDVEQGIKNYCKEIEVKKTTKQYIQHGSTWFNNKGWLDDYDFTFNPLPNQKTSKYSYEPDDGSDLPF